MGKGWCGVLHSKILVRCLKRGAIQLVPDTSGERTLTQVQMKVVERNLTRLIQIVTFSNNQI